MQIIKSKVNSSRGGAIAELLITLPLLLLLFAGMAFLGRKLSLFGIISQTTFNAAMYAAGLNSNDPQSTETTDFANVLFNSSQRSRNFSNHAFSVAYTDLDSDSRADLVTVSFDGMVDGLGFASAFGVSPLLVNTTLPVLGSGAAASSIDPSFHNPDRVYCADGSSAASAAGCAPVVTDPGNEGGDTGCLIVQGYCKDVQTIETIETGIGKDVGGGFKISDDGKTIVFSK